MAASEVARPDSPVSIRSRGTSTITLPPSSPTLSRPITRRNTRDLLFVYPDLTHNQLLNPVDGGDGNRLADRVFQTIQAQEQDLLLRHTGGAVQVCLRDRLTVKKRKVNNSNSDNNIVGGSDTRSEDDDAAANGNDAAATNEVGNGGGDGADEEGGKDDAISMALKSLHTHAQDRRRHQKRKKTVSRVNAGLGDAAKRTDAETEGRSASPFPLPPRTASGDDDDDDDDASQTVVEAVESPSRG